MTDAPEPPENSQPPIAGDGELARAIAEANRAGVRVVRLDLAGCADKRDLLRRVAASFELPRWFGHNWDALADSLADLPAQQGRGCLLILAGWRDFARRQPDAWQTLCEILAETGDTLRDDGFDWLIVRSGADA